MALGDEQIDRITNNLGPIIDNVVARITNAVKETVRDEVLRKLSNKEITIKLPDLTKNA